MGMKFSWDFPGIFRSRKSGMEFSIYLHSRSRKWEWNLPFTFTFPFPKMGMEFAISRSRSRSPKVIPAHGWTDPPKNYFNKVWTCQTYLENVSIFPMLAICTEMGEEGKIGFCIFFCLLL